MAAGHPLWWEIRRAQSTKPATYSCPLCGGRLPALSEHMLLFPEGDHSRRRHAHSACVLAARREGRLPTRQEATAAARGDANRPARPWYLRWRDRGGS
ncbi:hypothetical protein [Conexibacter sp. DBS9H8]|uniref:hypothetical protein n=1 Tax=Conexibacter sp. DBS9H8 TaxID=2937801 RepID=UPI00200C681A|nr:hypothetical protein [Conexibacter sp. DBS9H8]